MFPGKKARNDKAEFDESRQSFHDLLLYRSKSCLGPRRRGIAAKFAIWRTWGVNGAQVPEWVAETAIFAGGVAIGAGVFLLKRGVTTSLRGQAVIGLGLGFFVVTILARGLSRLRSRPWSQAARTE